MSFQTFIINLYKYIGVPLPNDLETITGEIILAQRALEKINEYFFQTYQGIGKTIIDDKEYQYFSDFHKFWEAHHKEIINPQINKTQARKAADALHQSIVKYGTEILKVNLNTHGLSKQAIAQVRFFTANQDFRQPPDDQFGKYHTHFTTRV